MTTEFNYIGAFTLYKKESYRFIKVYNQTLLAPVITAMLFLAVFNLAIGEHVKLENNISFVAFISSGLIIMSAMQNAFANSSSSLTMGKILGAIIDVLMPPLSAFEITLAMTLAGITRGICVGILVWLAINIFYPIHIHNYAITIFYFVGSTMFLAILGILSGIISESFDQMAAITSYIITPLSFLSGTFYPISQLPSFWYKISHLNPFYYMIDGVRYGMTGYHDGSILIGMVVVSICNIVLFTTAVILIKKGYRIKG